MHARRPPVPVPVPVPNPSRTGLSVARIVRMVLDLRMDSWTLGGALVTRILLTLVVRGSVRGGCGAEPPRIFITPVSKGQGFKGSGFYTQSVLGSTMNPRGGVCHPEHANAAASWSSTRRGGRSRTEGDVHRRAHPCAHSHCRIALQENSDTRLRETQLQWRGG